MDSVEERCAAARSAPIIRRESFSTSRSPRTDHPPVHVDSVVLGREHHRIVVHQRHVEALGVLHLRFQRVQQLTSLSENGYIEVVVIVGHQNFAALVYADAWG